MPTYQFRCKDGHEFERLMSFAEFDRSKRVRCPECKKGATRAPGGFLSFNSSQTPLKAGRPQQTRYHPW